MKKLLAIALAGVLISLAGCSKSQVSHNGLITVVREVIDGHEYFVVYRGGIIHSESCTNAVHQRSFGTVTAGPTILGGY